MCTFSRYSSLFYLRPCKFLWGPSRENCLLWRFHPISNSSHQTLFSHSLFWSCPCINLTFLFRFGALCRCCPWVDPSKYHPWFLIFLFLRPSHFGWNLSVWFSVLQVYTYQIFIPSHYLGKFGQSKRRDQTKNYQFSHS